MNENYQTIRDNFIRNEELKRLEELKSKYANFQQPDYSTMSTRDALQTRFDLQKLNELQQKYGMQQMQTAASIPQSVYAQEDQPKRKVYQSLTGFKPHQTEWYENNPQKDSIDFINDKPETSKLVNDCLKSERYRRFMDYLYQPEVEGEGYVANPKLTDQPTFSGLSENLYKLTRNKFPEIAHSYPEKLEQLNKAQRENVMCQTVFKPQHIDAINNERYAKTLWDMVVNHNPGKTAIPMIQESINKIPGYKVNVDNILGTQTISTINYMTPEELKQLNNLLLEKRKAFINKESEGRFRKGLLRRANNLKW